MMSMFSSPGMPKIYSTPSFSRHFTNDSAAFMVCSSRRMETSLRRAEPNRSPCRNPFGARNMHAPNTQSIASSPVAPPRCSLYPLSPSDHHASGTERLSIIAPVSSRTLRRPRPAAVSAPIALPRVREPGEQISISPSSSTQSAIRRTPSVSTRPSPPRAMRRASSCRTRRTRGMRESSRTACQCRLGSGTRDPSPPAAVG